MTDEAAGKLFVSECSAVSGRRADIAEEHDSIWLYLTAPDGRSIVSSVWLLNLPTAPSEPGQSPYREQAAPPALPRRHVVGEGVQLVPPASRLGFLWSKDGNAVAAVLDSRPIGFLKAGSHRGSARHASSGAEAWALPWDAVAFRGLFPDSAVGE